MFNKAAGQVLTAGAQAVLVSRGETGFSLVRLPAGG